MSETDKKCNENAQEAKISEKIIDVTNVIGNVYSKEEIATTDDSSKDYAYDYDGTKNGDMLQNQDNGLEENFDIFDTVTNPLYAAWWNYVRKNKGKKKKRKMLEIYRDENYWADDKCSEDEFDYATI